MPINSRREQLGDMLADRLRTERVLRDAAVMTDRRRPMISREVADAQAAAILRLAIDDLGGTIPAAELAHCLAAVLASTRQSFYAVNDLSDRTMQEVMPFVSHLSVLAESMVGLSDLVADQDPGETDSSSDGDLGHADFDRTDATRTGRRNGLRSV